MYDYRDDRGYQRRGKRLKNDYSVQTYYGHKVSRTLIRAYFSPLISTNEKYVYSGSSDACIYIYDILTGQIIQKLNEHRNIIRDVSWHPKTSQIISASWDGTCLVWSKNKSRENDINLDHGSDMGWW